jgi:hypothetical protein
MPLRADVAGRICRDAKLLEAAFRTLLGRPASAAATSACRTVVNATTRSRTHHTVIRFMGFDAVPRGPVLTGLDVRWDNRVRRSPHPPVGDGRSPVPTELHRQSISSPKAA